MISSSATKTPSQLLKSSGVLVKTGFRRWHGSHGTLNVGSADPLDLVAHLANGGHEEDRASVCSGLVGSQPSKLLSR